MQGHVRRGFGRPLTFDRRARRGLREGVRVAKPAGHDVEGGGDRLRILVIAPDGGGFAPAEVPGLLDLHQHVADGVGGAAGDAECVAELEVEGPVPEDDHVLPLSGV